MLASRRVADCCHLISSKFIVGVFLVQRKLDPTQAHHWIKMHISEANCTGDFNWKRLIDLSNIKYIDGDIVSDMVKKNNVDFGSDTVLFQIMNTITDAKLD